MRAAPAHATFERAGTPCTLQIPLQKDRFKSLTKNGYISVQLTREWVPRVSPEFLQIDSECRGSGHGEERGGGPDGPEPPPELGLRASIGRGRVSPSRDLKGTRSCQEVFLVMPKGRTSKQSVVMPKGRGLGRTGPKAEREVAVRRRVPSLCDRRQQHVVILVRNKGPSQLHKHNMW